jgi:hypothetical protein
MTNKTKLLKWAATVLATATIGIVTHNAWMIGTAIGQVLFMALVLFSSIGDKGQETK